jgi:hypothetical protein
MALGWMYFAFDDQTPSFAGEAGTKVQKVAKAAR